MRGSGLLLVVALVLPGCLSEDVTGAAENVLTFQDGTMSELRRRRGQGTRRSYPVAPTVMLGVVERAARRARGAGGHPVRAIFVSPTRGEVIAKERAAEEAQDTSYGAPFRSAMLAIVLPVPGRSSVSQVEIHALHRGPFHKGRVNWERDMPGWIDAVLAEDEALREIP